MFSLSRHSESGYLIILGFNIWEIMRAKSQPAGLTFCIIPDQASHLSVKLLGPKVTRYLEIDQWFSSITRNPHSNLQFLRCQDGLRHDPQLPALLLYVLLGA